MSEYHAVLGPSGAERWMTCPGSPVMEAGRPDNGSWYADEGSAAHLLATWCLTDKLPAAEYIGETIRIGERSFEVTKDMAGHVQSYVDFVRKETEGGVLLVEQRVPIHHLTGETDAGGTADAVGLFPSRKHLKVIDLKYGAGEAVSALENKQAMMYGLGALAEYDMLGDFDEVSLYIHQPRMDYVGEYHISAAELLAFGEKVKLAALEVAEAEKMFNSPGIDEVAWEDEYLRPSEKGCRWCKAKHNCPAKAKEVVEAITGEPATAEDFASLVVKPVGPEDGANFLTIAMGKVGAIEDWCKSVRAELERRLFAGETFAEYKLVEGKMGNRAWADTKAVEETMKSMRLKQDEMYDRKVISPTAAEKLLKKANPGKWERLQAHITRAPGRPSVAHASDPRPAMAITATADDFAEFAQVESTE